MIHIVKRGTEFERHLIERGAELIDVIQHGSEYEQYLIESGAKLINSGTWALYSLQTIERIYEKKVEKSVTISR
jgi:hypothetical protein